MKTSSTLLLLLLVHLASVWPKLPVLVKEIHPTAAGVSLSMIQPTEFNGKIYFKLPMTVP
jgi:hypothetical protein